MEYSQSQKKIIGWSIIAAILLIQFLTGLWHITDPYIDGRYHYNWGPPFWLMNAKATNDAGLLKSYFGVVRSYEAPNGQQDAKISYYASHPELIGPTFALWTRVFGYNEWSPRLFALVMTMATSLLLFLTFYKSFGLLFASIFSAFFVALPLIYVYGKMLDPVILVLFFLSVTLFGFVKTLLNEKYAWSILAGGILAMGLSDWSGLVFGGLIFILSVYLFRRDPAKLKKAVFIIASAIILSLLLYFIQIYLQAKLPLNSIIQNYTGLLKYRAGIGANDQIGWSNYFWSQIYYLKDNFTLSLAALGAIGLFAAAYIESRKSNNVVRSGTVLAVLSIFIGELAYMTFVKQASTRHIYYQYYLAIPLTFGIIYFWHWCATKFFSYKKVFIFFLILGGAVILWVGWNSYKVYTSLLFQDMWGDLSDIELFKTLKNIPPADKIIVADNETTLEWFSNPNISYYAERSLEPHLIGTEPNDAPYYIFPMSGANLKLAVLNSSRQNKSNYATIQSCSQHFCLIKNGGPASNLAAEKILTKKFNSPVYGYSLEYPAILTGGFQKLTSELKNSGVQESIALQTPSNFTDQLMFFISVENRLNNSLTLESFADNYEKNSRAAGIQLVKIASKQFFAGDADIIEREYSVQKSSVPYGTIRFAINRSRFYVFSVFRALNTRSSEEMKQVILDSIRFL